MKTDFFLCPPSAIFLRKCVRNAFSLSLFPFSSPSSEVLPGLAVYLIESSATSDCSSFVCFFLFFEDEDLPPCDILALFGLRDGDFSTSEEEEEEAEDDDDEDA